MPNSSQLLSRAWTCLRERTSRIASRLVRSLGSVGTLWSAVASVRSGRRTRRPESRSPSNACAEVTSWTRCRSTYRSEDPPSRSGGRTSCASQTFWNIVLGIGSSLAPSQAGGHHGDELGLAAAGILEMVSEVGVERDGVAL